MKRISRSIAAAALLLTLCGVGAAEAQTFRPPSARAERALAALAAPSYPRPLPGSAAVGPSAYFRPGGCAQVRAGYQAPGAPLPAGARLTVREATLFESPGFQGNLQFSLREDMILVESDFGPSAIFLTEHTTGCFYHIALTPTLVIEGAGAVPSGEAFAYALCHEQGEERSVFASGEIGGRPYLVLVRPSSGEDFEDLEDLDEEEWSKLPRWFGLVRPGTISDLMARPDVNLPREGWPAALEERPDGTIVVTLTSDAGPVRVLIDCTAGGSIAIRARSPSR